MRLLLDTHALIWLAHEEEFDADAFEKVRRASLQDSLYVSAITAWELTNLHVKRRLYFDPDPVTWWRRSVEQWRVLEAPLSAVAALNAGLLSWAHRDPADRMLVAQAIESDAALVTRDAETLAYAANSDLEVLPC